MDQTVHEPPIGDWPAGLTRVPYWVYRDPDIARDEQTRVFEGPAWHFLCLEIDVERTGDYRTTMMGAMPVVVARTETGEIVAFENRCAHRGALICLDDGGSAKDFQCVYHAWRYDLRGNLTSVAFRRGVNGQGGMPDNFRMEAHGPRKLRIDTLCGLVFGTLRPTTPDIEAYIGPEVLAGCAACCTRQSRSSAGSPSNCRATGNSTWRTSATPTTPACCTLFFTTFRITRLSQGGGVMVSENGVAHASTTLAAVTAPDDSYAGIRSDNQGFQLRDPSFMTAVAEFNDNINLQILSVFPGLRPAADPQCAGGAPDRSARRGQHGSALDLPRFRRRHGGTAGDASEAGNLAGPAGFVSMEDGAVGGFVQRGIAAADRQSAVVEMGGASAGGAETRATEASVRGFWKAWRTHMGL